MKFDQTQDAPDTETFETIRPKLPLLIENVKHRCLSLTSHVGDRKSNPFYIPDPSEQGYPSLIDTGNIFKRHGLSLTALINSEQAEIDFFPLVVGRKGDRPDEHPTLLTLKIINDNDRTLIAIPRLEQYRSS